MKMKQSELDVWIGALESGNYLQGKGHLKSEKDGVCQFCCLGILEEVLGTESVKSERLNLNDSTTYYFKGNSGLQETTEVNYLTINTVQRFATSRYGASITGGELHKLIGIKESHESWNSSAKYSLTDYNLAELNDLGYTFPEIAKVLRAVVEIIPE